jgi:transcriptional repressor NrdR
MEQVSAIVDSIENHYANEMRTLVTSSEIGDMVLEKLKSIDSVSYIRFASVYKEFTDVDSFIKAISELGQKK